VVGTGPVRTGVTVVHPRGKANPDPVFAAWFTLNGNGEMTGTTWVQESGLLEGPVAITNTHSVGVVRDAIIRWEVSQKNALQPWWLPDVAETYDGGLNDINGFHVTPAHVIAALDNAAGGVPKEGVVGGGTGWSATASRAASARRRENFRRTRADTRSAYSCNATTDRAATCGSPVSRSARRFRIWPAASPTRIRCRPIRRGGAATNPDARPTSRTIKDPSSSSSRPTRRCCRIS
jgi:L-aminopeptidase/D-esterase-like protein